jgi:hypothetical protein
MTIEQIITSNEPGNMLLLRERPSEGGQARQYTYKQYEGKKKGWVLLDAYTQGAMRAVFAALNEDNRAKLNQMPLASVASICMKFAR